MTINTVLHILLKQSLFYESEATLHNVCQEDADSSGFMPESI